jgi:DNA primase
VAACGTAFGDDHLAMLRRLLMDDSYFRGEVIYTFDGDAAGQAAALKAFEGDQKMAGQTYVAVAPDGMDPCELRQSAGDAAVRDLVARRIPMFKFVVRSLLAEHDLDTGEGRVEALRRTVPVVARIKDEALREDYARQLAGWVGWDDIPTVIKRVREEARRNSPRSGRGQQQPRQERSRVPEQGPAEAPAGPARPNPTDPRCGRSGRRSSRPCSTRRSPARCSTHCRPNRSPTPRTRWCATRSRRRAGPARGSAGQSGWRRSASGPSLCSRW